MASLETLVLNNTVIVPGVTREFVYVVVVLHLRIPNNPQARRCPLPTCILMLCLEPWFKALRSHQGVASRPYTSGQEVVCNLPSVLLCEESHRAQQCGSPSQEEGMQEPSLPSICGAQQKHERTTPPQCRGGLELLPLLGPCLKTPVPFLCAYCTVLNINTKLVGQPMTLGNQRQRHVGGCRAQAIHNPGT